MAERHRESEAQNTAHAQSLGEIEALKALIATTVSERDEALAASSLLQATLAERDSALTEMSQRANDFVAALQSAEAKLAKSNGALSRTEREIVALRGDLAAARDVGRAALAALRTDPATAPAVPRNAGWLALVLRPFRLPRKESIAHWPGSCEPRSSVTAPRLADRQRR